MIELSLMPVPLRSLNWTSMCPSVFSCDARERLAVERVGEVGGRRQRRLRAVAARRVEARAEDLEAVDLERREPEAGERADREGRGALERDDLLAADRHG